MVCARVSLGVYTVGVRVSKLLFWVKLLTFFTCGGSQVGTYNSAISPRFGPERSLRLAWTLLGRPKAHVDASRGPVVRNARATVL